MNSIPQVGELAPDFSIFAQDGNQVNLATFAGKWLVLYFYPKDNTPGCTTEAKDFTCLKSDFTELGATVVGVSPDSVKSHGKFINKQELSLILLSDPEHQVAEAYGVWQLKKFMGKEYMGVVRSTFLIDPKRAIAHVWSNLRVKGHAENVLAKLRELSR
ncbi:MAG: thioredoxin-dependent thiol peroxidase [Richelia sp.]|nr:thioredoxin-dependent thiol peroxidase [Richelia sp.]CDN15372.1 Thiol peroxidase, Bcp-type [Richelia intracellularis]